MDVPGNTLRKGVSGIARDALRPRAWCMRLCNAHMYSYVIKNLYIHVVMYYMLPWTCVSCKSYCLLSFIWFGLFTTNMEHTSTGKV